MSINFVFNFSWYHSCQSWNGKTGEWQIWVNAERVGRGFHNRVSLLFLTVIKFLKWNFFRHDETKISQSNLNKSFLIQCLNKTNLM